MEGKKEGKKGTNEADVVDDKKEGRHDKKEGRQDKKEGRTE